MSDSESHLTWVTDRHGDSLYAGEEFVGCIYARDGGSGLRKGWRVLDNHFRKVIDVEPSSKNPRLSARSYLEEVLAPLPTAEQLIK